MTSLNVVGVLVISDGRIVLERYARGHTAETRWESWSAAKSVTSMLFGAAIRDGRIATLDDEVGKYVPSLAGTSYDGVTLRHLLQMSSGVAWNGNMSDPKSDVAQLPRLNREGFSQAGLALGTLMAIAERSGDRREPPGRPAPPAGRFRTYRF